MRPFAPEESDDILIPSPLIGQHVSNATFSETQAQEAKLIRINYSRSEEWIVLRGNITTGEEGTAVYHVGSGTTKSVGASSDAQTSTKENQRFDLDEIRSVFYSIGEDDDFLLQKEHSEIIAKYIDHRPSWIRDLIFYPQSSIESAFRTLVFIGKGLRSRFDIEALDILCLALSHHAPYLRHGSIMAYLAWDNPAITKILSAHRKSETSPALCRLIDRALQRRSA